MDKIMDDDVKELIERILTGRAEMIKAKANGWPNLLADVAVSITLMSEANAQLKQDIADIAQYKPQEIDAELAAKDARIEELEKHQIQITDEYREERAGEGFWHSCSGCHSTNEGASTGWYSVHPFFECEMGSGCSECGHLGAIWDDIDYEEMVELDRQALSEGET